MSAWFLIRAAVIMVAILLAILLWPFYVGYGAGLVSCCPVRWGVRRSGGSIRDSHAFWAGVLSVALVWLARSATCRIVIATTRFDGWVMPCMFLTFVFTPAAAVVAIVTVRHKWRSDTK